MNIKELDTYNVRKIQLDLLKKIIDFCEIRNIKYFLSYGSLLGAIRHGGFIPWDDDVDISMERSDYDRFIAEFADNPPKNCDLLSIETNKDYVYLFAKVVNPNTDLIEEDWPEYSTGIYIDIFPIDKLPNNNTIRNIYLFIAYKLQYIAIAVLYAKRKNQNKLNTPKKKFLAFIINILFFWASSQIFMKIYNIFIRSFKFDCSEFSLNIAGDYKDKIIPSSILTKTTKVKFENLQIDTFQETNKYLTIMYGNYMQLPPIKDRAPKHNYKAYLKENINK